MSQVEEILARVDPLPELDSRPALEILGYDGAAFRANAVAIAADLTQNAPRQNVVPKLEPATRYRSPQGVAEGRKDGGTSRAEPRHRPYRS